jgi:hypothetical protein
VLRMAFVYPFWLDWRLIDEFLGIGLGIVSTQCQSFLSEKVVHVCFILSV